MHSRFRCGAWSHGHGQPIHYRDDLFEFGSDLTNALRMGWPIIGHNIICYDLPIIIHNLYRAQYEWVTWKPVMDILQADNRSIEDTLIWSRKLLPKRQQHGLESWAKTLAGVYGIDEKVKIANFHSASDELLKERVTHDVRISCALVDYFVTQYDAPTTVPDHEFDKQWCKVVLDLMVTGLPFDRQEARVMSNEFREREREHKKVLDEENADLNWNSPKQIHEHFLRTKGRGLPIKEETGNPILNKKNIPLVMQTHPILYHAVQAKAEDHSRKYITPHLVNKKKGKTYVGWTRCGSPITGGQMAYANLNYLGTRTGRMQYQNPPIQQMPKAIRRVFKAPPGWMFVGFDIVALEMAILGYLMKELGNDETIKGQVDRGESVKKLTLEALKDVMHNVRLFGDETKEDVAKELNYSFLYGAGINYLCKRLNLTPDDQNKREVRAAFSRRFPNLEGVMSLLRASMSGGIIRDLFNRPIIGEEWTVLNSWCQASGAIYAQRMMFIVWKFLRELLSGARASVYNMDELQLLVPEESLSSFTATGLDRMVNAHLKTEFEKTFGIPLITGVEVMIGKSWSETH